MGANGIERSIRLNCPSCGTRFAYEGSSRYATCPACGRSVAVKR